MGTGLGIGDRGLSPQNTPGGEGVGVWHVSMARMAQIFVQESAWSRDMAMTSMRRKEEWRMTGVRASRKKFNDKPYLCLPKRYKSISSETWPVLFVPMDAQNRGVA